jgi:hypothetical protein
VILVAAFAIQWDKCIDDCDLEIRSGGLSRSNNETLREMLLGIILLFNACNLGLFSLDIKLALLSFSPLLLQTAVSGS